MSDDLESIQKRQRKELEKFVDDCPHTDIVVEDYSFGSRRDITLRCKRCRLNVAGYSIDGQHSYMAYVNEVVSKHPGNIGNIRKRQEK